MKEVGVMSHTARMPVVRFSLAGILSVITTFLLFFLMQELIRTTTNTIPDDSGPTYVLNFVRVKPVEHVRHTDPVPPPQEVKEQPPLPPIESSDETSFHNTPIVIDKVGKDIGNGPTTIGDIVAGEGDYLPVFKVIPVYPISASSRGIEGYTIVEYTVTAYGATRDIRVIQAEPPSIFNRASIEAAAKFKYKPRVIEGIPVEVHGVTNKFTFQLE